MRETFMHSPEYKVRTEHIELAYPSLPKEKAILLEEKIKSNYICTDYQEDDVLGYEIKDKKRNNKIRFSPNARLTLETRYLEKDQNKNVIENILDLFARVAVNIATAELKYKSNKDIIPLADEFFRMMVYKEFMPNTPTLCNAGRELQQLSACFVLPIEDYVATDDIGEDPEKQGNGIYDALRYMTMVHKSGGGTGFNFSDLRPKSDKIITTFGSSSGPTSFIHSHNQATNDINQGGFRRGANMAILEYWHPDIFEFIFEKSKGTLVNFNLSVGVDNHFMEAAEKREFIKLYNPKNKNKFSLEQRVWKSDKLIKIENYDVNSKEWQDYKLKLINEDKQLDTHNIVSRLKKEFYYIKKGQRQLENIDVTNTIKRKLRLNYERILENQDLKLTREELIKNLENDGYYKDRLENIIKKKKSEYERALKEMCPSLLLSENGLDVILRYTDEIIGKLNEAREVLIDADKMLNLISEQACNVGCPGLVFMDKIERDNPTPHVGKISSTNPCGEQPLLPYEACNLGAVNLKTCIIDGEFSYERLEDIVRKGVRFLDNVIDMSKFPFKKIYAQAKGNRKIGLGLMGFGDVLFELGIKYDSKEALEFAEKTSKFITDKARSESEKLAEERGMFPNWKGSVYDPEADIAANYNKEGKKGKKVRNATVTTIAPNGTTGMLVDVSGGIEPVFSLYFTKTCMDGRTLEYKTPFLEKIIKDTEFDKVDLLFDLLENKGSLQNIEEIPEEIKALFKTAHDIGYEWHVKMQSAFQKGIDNAVSKTVNMPYGSKPEDVRKIYEWSWKNGCKGITVFVDGSKPSVLSTKDEIIKPEEIIVVENEVEKQRILEISPYTLKAKIHRDYGSSLHITLPMDLYLDKNTKKAYLLPHEIFQSQVPLGTKSTVDFAQEGIDRSDIFRGDNPDYAEIITRLKSPSSDEAEGFGPAKVKSTHHAVGVFLEYALLSVGVIDYDESGKLRNVIRKKNLTLLTYEQSRQILNNQRPKNNNSKKLLLTGNIKLGERFECPLCFSTEYTFKDGCYEPACTQCGTTLTGRCG